MRSPCIDWAGLRWNGPGSADSKLPLNGMDQMTSACLTLLFCLQPYSPFFFQNQTGPVMQAQEVYEGTNGTFLRLRTSVSVLRPISESITGTGGGTRVTYLVGATETAAVPQAEPSSMVKDFSGLLAIVCAVLSMGAVSAFTQGFKTSSGRQKLKTLAWAVLFGIGAVVCGYNYLVEHNKTASLWIDNASAGRFQVFVSGVWHVELPPQSHVELDVVVKDGWEIARGPKEIALRLEPEQSEPVLATLLMEKWGHYLYNIGGINSYRLTTRTYR